MMEISNDASSIPRGHPRIAAGKAVDDAPPAWITVNTGGVVYSARTGHTIISYQKLACTPEELRIRLAFLSTQLPIEDMMTDDDEPVGIAHLPPEINLIIFSYLELPIKNSILLFGGTNNRNRLNDIHELDLRKGIWKEAVVNGVSAPEPRSGAKGIVMNHQFILFGGYNGRGGSFYNDLWSYDIPSNSWALLEGTGAPPSPRTDHTVCALNGELVVFGGFNGRKRFNDVIRYDFAMRSWTMCEVSQGEMPSKRFGHSAVVYNGDMYVFGGWDGSRTLSTLHRYRVEFNHWSDVEIVGPPPPHRYRHTAAVHKECMFVYGGVDSDHRRFSDLQCYNFVTKTWAEIILRGDIPTRSFHSSVVIDEELYIVGGYDGVHRLNDMHKCALKVPEVAVAEPEEDDEMI